MKKFSLLPIAVVVLFVLSLLWQNEARNLQEENEGGLIREEKRITHPLQISEMRKAVYPGSKIIIEQTLLPEASYNQYIASYKSDGLKIYGFLTVPTGQKPENGWPVIVFNHGYIPPEEYRTTERYAAYVDGFARRGYIVFKPDYRGHGNSEGEPTGAYYSTGYTVDVLNAVSTLKKFKEGDPERIGMWGHSLGGYITLKSMVVTRDIKAGVIWSGVVASHKDMINSWKSRTPWSPSLREKDARRTTRQKFIEMYGTPEENPEFWNSISPINFVKDISGPVQLHHGLSDETVPPAFSELLKSSLDKEEKVVEYYTYEGNDHNLSQSFSVAMQRSVEFFDRYLK